MIEQRSLPSGTMGATFLPLAASRSFQKPPAPSSEKPTTCSSFGSSAWKPRAPAVALALPAKQTFAPESPRMYFCSASCWFSYIGTQVAPRLCVA